MDQFKVLVKPEQNHRVLRLLYAWPGQEKEARSDFAPIPLKEDEGWTKQKGFTTFFPTLSSGLGLITFLKKIEMPRSLVKRISRMQERLSKKRDGVLLTYFPFLLSNGSFRSDSRNSPFE